MIPQASTSNAITVVTTSLSIPDTFRIPSSKTRALEISSYRRRRKSSTHTLVTAYKNENTRHHKKKWRKAQCWRWNAVRWPELLYDGWDVYPTESEVNYLLWKLLLPLELNEDLDSSGHHEGREARLWPAQTCHFYSVWATCPSQRSQPSPCTSCVTDLI